MAEEMVIRFVEEGGGSSTTETKPSETASAPVAPRVAQQTGERQSKEAAKQVASTGPGREDFRRLTESIKQSSANMARNIAPRRIRDLGGRAIDAAGAIGQARHPTRNVAIPVAPPVARPPAAAGGTAARVASLAGRAGPAGLAVAGVAVAAVATTASLGALGKSAKSVSDRFGRIGDDIEAYSPSVARVRGRFEAQREIARVERARRLGPRVAAVDHSRNQLSSAVYDLKTSFLDSFADLQPVVEAGVDSLTAVVRGLQVVKEAIDLAIPGGNPQKEIAEIGRAAKEFARAAQKIVDSNDKIGTGIDPEIDRLINESFHGLQGGQGNGVRPNPDARP